MPPMESRPYVAWMRLNSEAAWPIASSQRHLAPGIGDLGADHRLGDAVLVGRIAPGEAALDAGMAVVGLAVLVRHHAHHLVALHLGLERAADAAIGAGGDDAVLGLARLDDGLLHQRRGRAGLHAGAAGDAFRVEEVLVLAGGDTTSRSRGRRWSARSALHFLAGAHAARADDAFRGIEGEVGVATSSFSATRWFSPS